MARKKLTIGFSLDDESMDVIKAHQATNPLLETPSAALRNILWLFKQGQATQAAKPKKEAARG